MVDMEGKITVEGSFFTRPFLWQIGVEKHKCNINNALEKKKDKFLFFYGFWGCCCPQVYQR